MDRFSDAGSIPARSIETTADKERQICHGPHSERFGCGTCFVGIWVVLPALGLTGVERFGIIRYSRLDNAEGCSMDKRKKLPIGIENFEEIRREGFYYVDKTGFIEDLLENWGKVNLFTRPRRFGKSLNMNI